jgi:putative hydrolase of the HAD superfamily
MKKEVIKAVIFDIGGVVYLGKQRANHYMREQLGLDKISWEKSTKSVWENLLIGAINEEIGMIKMAKNLGIRKEELKRLWIKAFKVRFVLNRPLLGLIKRLKKNYKTAILSDQWSIPYKVLITKELKSSFDVMVFSHIFGVRKTQIKIYRETLKKLKLKPQECIFIDNEDWNLTPAKKLGMKTILFKNNNQLTHELRKLNVTK